MYGWVRDSRFEALRGLSTEGVDLREDRAELATEQLVPAVVPELSR